MFGLLGIIRIDFDTAVQPITAVLVRVVFRKGIHVVEVRGPGRRPIQGRKKSVEIIKSIESGFIMGLRCLGRIKWQPRPRQRYLTPNLTRMSRDLLVVSKKRRFIGL